MHPYDCEGTNEHDFQKDEKSDNYTCYHCNMSLSEYEKESEKIKIFQENFKLITKQITSNNPEKYASLVYELVNKLHRTNQQDFFRTLHLFIKKMSKSESDMRNQDSVEWCKKVIEIDVNFPRI